MRLKLTLVLACACAFIGALAGAAQLRAQSTVVVSVSTPSGLSDWTRVAGNAGGKAGHYGRPPHLRAWLCIHRYEGSWKDPNPPYYGGLQMDLRFQRTYGSALLRRKGTANHWTPLEQMWAAERAHRSGRGFYPWPHSARRCGLI